MGPSGCTTGGFHTASALGFSLAVTRAPYVNNDDCHWAVLNDAGGTFTLAFSTFNVNIYAFTLFA